jgi:hypothetical protein
MFNNKYEKLVKLEKQIMSQDRLAKAAKSFQKYYIKVGALLRYLCD